jgi:hypothetical protein
MAWKKNYNNIFNMANPTKSGYKYTCFVEFSQSHSELCEKAHIHDQENILKNWYSKTARIRIFSNADQITDQAVLKYLSLNSTSASERRLKSIVQRELTGVETRLKRCALINLSEIFTISK